MNPMQDSHIKGCFMRARSELADASHQCQWKPIVYLLQADDHEISGRNKLTPYGGDTVASERQVTMHGTLLRATVVADLSRVEEELTGRSAGESGYPGGAITIPVFSEESSNPSLLARPVLGAASFSTLIAPEGIISNFELQILARKFAYLLVRTLNEFFEEHYAEAPGSLSQAEIPLPDLMLEPKISFKHKDEEIIDETGDVWVMYQHGRYAKLKSLLQVKRYRERVKSSAEYMQTLG